MTHAENTPPNGAGLAGALAAAHAERRTDLDGRPLDLAAKAAILAARAAGVTDPEALREAGRRA